jgi:tricorn protease
MSVVYVYNLKTNKEYPVTEKWYDSSSPVFSTDGKYLIFNSNRDLNPIYSRVEWDYAYTSMGGIYLATLAKDTPSPLLPKDDQISLGDDKPAGPQGPGKPGEAKDAKNVDVKIDADGIFNRIVKMPVRGGEGYMSFFFSDGKKLWYQSGRSLMVYDFAKGEDNKVTDGRIMAYTDGGKKAILSDRGKYYIVDFPSEHIKADKPVSTDNLKAIVDFSQEWPQIFDEVWRAFRDGFYLENMHGVDWKAIKQKYAELLPYVKTRLDLNYVIGEMISELACGHAYVSTGEKPEAERIDMGLLGA